MNTPLQQKIYLFIADFIKQHDYSPSQQEIARGLGLSPKSISLISRNVHALVDTGKLAFHKKGHRNLYAVERDKGSLYLKGRIAAGVPIEAIQDERSIDLQPIFKEEHFFLEVKGDSMVEEGIFDKDLIICKPAVQAKEDDIVVALIDQCDTTLKRISYRVNGKIKLVPANPLLKPRLYAPERVQIQALFVGLLRMKR